MQGQALRKSCPSRARNPADQRPSWRRSIVPQRTKDSLSPRSPTGRGQPLPRDNSQRSQEAALQGMQARGRPTTVGEVQGRIVKLWFDVCLGPFRFTFDPDGELAEDEDEPRASSGYPLDASTETAWQPHQPELAGEPSQRWSYDPGDKPRRTGFGPTKE